MRKLLILLALSSALASATTTVSGSIKTLGTAAGTGSFVRFYLRGCRGNQPRVTGTGAIQPQQGSDSVFYVDIPADVNGNVSGTIYSSRDGAGTGAGDIECGGSRTAVWYGMKIFANGSFGPEMPVHAKSGATLDPSSVTPTSTAAVVTAPSGDTNYARLDGGNQPFTGAIQPPYAIFNERAAPVCSAGIDDIWGDSGAHRFSFCNNGGSVDRVVGQNTSDNLTNKALTAPAITGGSLAGTFTGNPTFSGSPNFSNGPILSNPIISGGTLNGTAGANSVNLLNFQGSAAPLTGDSTDQTMYTYTIPANTLGAGRGIKAIVAFQHSTGSTSTAYKFSLGSCNFNGTYATASTSFNWGTFYIFNNPGSQAAQTALINAPFWDAATPFAASVATCSIDMTASQILKYTFNVANTNAVTPKFFLVELVQ